MCLAAGVSGAALADTLIDNFDHPGAPAPWTFSNGAEFPGATGSLSAGTGYSGQGAHLAYDLTRGGRYVSANLNLPSPLSAAAIGFWVKSPPNITIGLRVVDSTGQTLQYNLRRPLDSLVSNAWYQHVVSLDSANGWWGGTNDGQMHLPFKAISILAADPLQSSTAAGAIDFDEVTALTSAVFDLDPGRQPLLPAPAGSGDLLTRLGVNIHFTSDNRALDAARAAGLTWVRMDLIWSAVETVKSNYNWTAYDGLLNALQSRGMRALLILDYGNALWTGANNLPPTNAVAIQAFGNFAQAAAAHFQGRNARLEIWNEPNGSGFWPPAADPVQYAALAAPTTARIHQGDPVTPVATGGLAGFDFDFATGYLAAGGGIGADAIGIHPYGCNPPELLSDRILFLRAIVAQYLTNQPPVWDTEWGFSSTWYGDGHSAAAWQRQAVMVSREVLAAGTAGFPLIIYYDLRDDGTNAADAEHNFGLLARDYADKPAMQAVKTIASVARGRWFTGFIHATPTGLSAMRFDGRTNMIVAVWPGTGAGQYTMTMPANVTATDFLGAPLRLLDWTNRLAWTFRETNGPVFITFPTTWQATNLVPVRPLLTNSFLRNGSFNAAVAGDAGPDYALQASSDLTSWQTVLTLTSPPTPFYFALPVSPAEPRRFYRAAAAPWP